MTGWNFWAEFFMRVEPTPTAATVYDPKDGAVWGKVGTIPLDGSSALKSLDQKADGGEVSVKMEVDEQSKKKMSVMFIRKTEGDSPVSLFSSGSHSVMTMAGPSGSRVAVYIKNGEPWPYIAALDKVKKATNQQF